MAASSTPSHPVGVFDTERLVVREWTTSPADVARCFDMYARWDVVRWLGATPRALDTPDGAVAAIERWRAVPAAAPDRPYGVWALEVRDTGTVAGTLLVKELPNGDGEVEVGWHLHPDSWGHGYATEAARAGIARTFTAGVDEIYAVVYPENTASLRVCERLGMIPLGRTTRWYGVEVECFRLRRPEPDARE